MDDRILGKRYENDYTLEDLEKIYSDIETAVAVPVNVVIKAEHRVLDLSRMEEILKGAERIVIQNCGCRVNKANCDAPRDVCVSIDEAATTEFTCHDAHAPNDTSATPDIGPNRGVASGKMGSCSPRRPRSPASTAVAAASC